MISLYSEYKPALCILSLLFLPLINQLFADASNSNYKSNNVRSYSHDTNPLSSLIYHGHTFYLPWAHILSKYFMPNMYFLGEEKHRKHATIQSRQPYIQGYTYHQNSLVRSHLVMDNIQQNPSKLLQLLGLKVIDNFCVQSHIWDIYVKLDLPLSSHIQCKTFSGIKGQIPLLYA